MAYKVLEAALVVVNELEETLWNIRLELVLLATYSTAARHTTYTGTGTVHQLDTLHTQGQVLYSS